jgi:uncharacterized protein
MEMTTHALSWFEIPVSDFERARTFYSRIFDFDMPVATMGRRRMGFLLHDRGRGIGGAIVKGEGHEPARDGVLVYLCAGQNLDTVLARVVPAGGTIVQDKTEVAPDLGFYALFIDSEGNRLALHSIQ